MSRPSDRWSRFFFWASFVLLIFGYGCAVGRYQIFPYSIFALAKKGYKRIAISKTVRHRGIVFEKPGKDRRTVVCDPDKMQPGLTLVSHINSNCLPAVNLVDMAGNSIHHWTLDWFDLWPDAKHVPSWFAPKSRPGTHIHGILLMPNGDLVFNFEFLGLLRVDLNGKVVWRLPYQTHHSITRGSDGNLWVCGRKAREKPCDRIPNWTPMFYEPTLLEVSPEGKIVHEWSVVDLLQKNGRKGLLYLSNIDEYSTKAKGDLLHLNDVEPFPDSMQEGFFTKGDVMVSLRNINTVFVFNRDTEKIKAVFSGMFVRQHDPDFIDGNTFSVFDNHCINDDPSQSSSRILIVKAPERTVTTYYEGTQEHPFYTIIMGKHQWLPNGNMIVVEGYNGRAFEIDRDKEIVWEYNNYLDDRHISFLEQATRIPLSYASLFQKKKSDAIISASASPTQQAMVPAAANAKKD